MFKSAMAALMFLALTAVAVAGDDKDSGVVILKNPKPASVVRQCQVSDAVVILRVVFHKSGKVAEVEVVSPSSCDAFDAAALKAANRIKFRPARKDGEAITVTKRIHYGFSRY